MRRMICHAMDYVRTFCQLHQAFTSDEVVEYMWSLSADCRTDEIYHHLLRILDKRLYSLPWARTGIAPDGTNEENTRLTTSYQQIGEWFRNEYKKNIESVIYSPLVQETGLYHPRSLSRLWSSWLKDERGWQVLGNPVIAIATIALFQKKFKLVGCNETKTLYDRIYPVISRLF